MSHLLSTPFNKPSPLDLPRLGHPLTPPETDFNYVAHHVSKSAPIALGGDLEPQPSFSNTETEVQTPQPRKISSLTYLNSGLKESRERVVQRSLKWLIVVLPPSSFTSEHGHLGSTLSSGPSSRLNQGSLMPLYPTMSGQLGAIAREYNFPSIAGLCVYLHTEHSGITITPRVSDDSWPLLWSHLFDPRSPSPPPPHIPIGGKIEFDIDLRKARWYGAWVAAPKKDFVDVPVSVTPSQPPSIFHWRGDSRTTFLDDQQEDFETVSLMQQGRPSRLGGRHIPRKLSLLDRFENSSVRSGSRPVASGNLSPPSPSPLVQTHTGLSPIAQEEEPKTARKHLDQLVTSWRASASHTASPMAATGQTSLDPANLPNSFPLDDSSPADTHPPSELNLSDYDWSVSSRGPPDEDDLESVESQWFPPSVHLDRRLQGSVCLTPSTCTSWGPPDYDLEYSPISNVARLPSPDVALRMLDDAPATPSTCTSWGPPSYPTSPTGIESNSRPLSIDLGHRGVFSRPRTPSTATSWGPPDSYPPSPSTPYYVRSPDIAERGFDLEFREDLPRNRPWRFVWPYQGARLSRASSHADVSSSEQVLPLSTSTGEPWRMIWPYLDIHGSGSVREEMHGSPSQHDGQPWQLVWPYTEIGAGADQQRVGASGPFSTTISASQSQPGMASEPWTLVWPYTAREDVQHPPQKTHLKAELPEGATQYPYFVVYPPVYPHFELYPEKAATVALHIPRPVVVSLGNSVSVNYPHFDLYPAVSTFERSDAVAPIPLTGCPSSQTISDSISVLLPASYPSLSIYPPVYPYNLGAIYPTWSVTTSLPATSTNRRSQAKEVVVKLDSCYPHLEIYPAVYPDNVKNIYPQITASELATKELAVTSNTDEILANTSLQSIAVSLTTCYPVFDIYPFVYPYNLDTIYSKCSIASDVQVADFLPIEPSQSFPESTGSCSSLSGTTMQVNFSVQYPIFNIYPAVYPYNLSCIYPSLDLGPDPSTTIGNATDQEQLEKESPPKTSFKLPPLPLRDSVLPPAQILAKTHSREHTSRVACLRSLSNAPPVPPLPPNVHRLKPISPASRLPLTRDQVEVPIGLPSVYPVIRPYPPVYPAIKIYPDVVVTTVARPSTATFVSFGSQASYPHIEPYPPVYPHFEIYPETGANRPLIRPVPTKPIGRVLPTPPARRRPKYTHSELHNQVFGHSTTHSRIPTPRQLPSPPSTTASRYGTSSSPSPSPPRHAQESFRRSMAGTSMNRSSLSTHPSDSAHRLSRQLPIVPGGGVHPTRGSPPRHYGLPSTPSPSRRLSTPTIARSSPSFSPLPSVPEPEALDPLSSDSPPTSNGRSFQPLNAQRRVHEINQLPYRGIASATLPQKAQPNPGASLSRTMSLPLRPLPHTSRNSAMIDSSPRGTPFSVNDSPSMRLAMSTLSQFPPPPRVPLPPVPNSRPVSKLDRSKYPFV